MNDTVIVGLIVAGGSLLTIALNGWVAAKSKREEWERQDEVADRAAAAAAELLAATEHVAETTARVAVATAENGAKLVEVHGLVNSSYTAALQAELGATTRELGMMREVIALHKEAGRTSNGEAQAAIDATQEKIAELTQTVADRLKQTDAAKIQVGVSRLAEQLDSIQASGARIEAAAEVVKVDLTQAHERAEAVERQDPPGVAADAAVRVTDAEAAILKDAPGDAEP